MTFLDFIYRNGIWISVPLFGIAAAFLAFSVVGLVRLNERSQLVSLPLLNMQTVQFPEAGRVALCVEGPRFTSRFSGLTFDLVSGDGKRLAGSAAWLHFTTSGMSTVRMEMRRFGIPEPGRYTLRIENLGSSRDRDAEHRIVFTKPHLLQTIGYILGIILAGGALIGSVVLFILRLLSKGGTP